MSSIVYLRNAKSNTIYAYLNESVWDPVKKKCVCKRKCIGHVDPITGNIVPNKASRPKENPSVKSRYVCKLFDRISEDLGLSEVLSLCFPDYWKKISTMAYYIAATGEEMYFCKNWSETHKTPSNQTMTPDVMNDILKNINSNSISLFFTLWRLRIQPSDVYVNTFLIKGYYIDLEEYSKNLDIEIDERSHKTKLELYFASKNEIPLCYNISSPTSNRRVGDYDVNRNSFSKLTSFVDENEGDPVDASLIAYAKSNIIARIRPDNDFVKNLTEKVSKTITDEENKPLKDIRVQIKSKWLPADAPEDPGDPAVHRDVHEPLQGEEVLRPRLLRLEPVRQRPVHLHLDHKHLQIRDRKRQPRPGAPAPVRQVSADKRRGELHHSGIQQPGHPGA